MKIVLRKRFIKTHKKLPPAVKQQFQDRLLLLQTDFHDPRLRVHKLYGDRLGLWSMNVTGDYRALFTVSGDTVTFYEIGTHSELYS